MNKVSHMVDYRRESGPIFDSAGLRKGSGNGTSGGMDDTARRLTILEEGFKHYQEDMKELKGDMKALRSDVAELKGRVASLPTTIQMIGMVLSVLAGAFAIIKFGMPH